MKQLPKKSFTHVWRPNTIDSVILPELERKKLKNLDKNFLFYGHSGTGKTTVGRILCEGRTVLVLNGSSENKIETVRGKIEEFASGNSLISTEKNIIRIEEFERFSKQAQDALKVIIEESEEDGDVIWIVSTNHPENIVKEVGSRFDAIDFNFPQYQRELLPVHFKDVDTKLAKYGFTIELEAKKLLFKRSWPDRRAIDRALHTLCWAIKDRGDNTIRYEDVHSTQLNVFESFWKLVLNKKTEEVYKSVRTKYLGREREVLQSFGTSLTTFLCDQHGRYDLASFTSILATEYMNYILRVPDENNCLYAFCNAVIHATKGMKGIE